MQHADTFDRLLEWSAWSRQDDENLGFKPRAGSAEGNYLPAAGDLFVDPDLIAKAPVISDDQGMRIERAVVAVGQPYIALVSAVFLRNLPLGFAARQLGIPNPRAVFDAGLQRIGERLAGLPDQRRSAATGFGATCTRPAA